MTAETLLLVGRAAPGAREVYGTHAERLRERGAAGSVRVATYEHDPQRELCGTLSELPAGRTYVVPMCLAHTHETTDALPAAFPSVPGDVQYCEPIGRSPSVTDAILDRAGAEVPAGPETSLVLVGFGNTTGSYHRQVTEYHAARARERSDYGGVVPCYLTQNPAVECVRYNVPTESAVAVPLFVAPSAATEERIPEKLELDRGGIAYADALGTHPRVTDAIQDRLQTRRVLAESKPDPASFEAALAGTARPLATDGDGQPQQGAPDSSVNESEDTLF
ncbi:MAG: cobalamin biosynthesis protein CbiX [Halobacteriales archaeon SW_9_67_25]|jgi:sirohydrochlorin ferrochelatase|nr:MAG: cobalamin biosynthesis protein CbiX [Halobacteriales archaeon SW_9_67_25]